MSVLRDDFTYNEDTGKYELSFEWPIAYSLEEGWWVLNPETGEAIVQEHTPMVMNLNLDDEAEADRIRVAGIEVMADRDDIDYPESYSDTEWGTGIAKGKLDHLPEYTLNAQDPSTGKWWCGASRNNYPWEWGDGYVEYSDTAKHYVIVDCNLRGNNLNLPGYIRCDIFNKIEPPEDPFRLVLYYVEDNGVLDTEAFYVDTVQEDTNWKVQSVPGNDKLPEQYAGKEIIGWKTWDGQEITEEQIRSTPVMEKEARYIAVLGEAAKDITIFYEAVNGTVSTAKETFPSNGEPKGSTATANPGYEFVEWRDGKGHKVEDVIYNPDGTVSIKPKAPEPNETYTAYFKVKTDGKLTLTKKFVGDTSLEPEITASFTIVLTDEKNWEELEKIAGGTGQPDKENGTLTFTSSLKNGGSFSLENIPRTAGIKITEDQPLSQNYNISLKEILLDEKKVNGTEFSNADLFLTNPDHHVQFVNQVTVKEDGVLTISKTVNGNAKDPDEHFTFTLKSEDLEGTYKVDYKETESSCNPSHSGEIKFESGEAAIYLRDGETAKIQGLKYGAVIFVTETGNEHTTGTTAILNDKPFEKGSQLTIGQKESVLAYTNTQSITIPTGIATDLLPYGWMLAAGALGFTGVKVRGRCRKEDEN